MMIMNMKMILRRIMVIMMTGMMMKALVIMIENHPILNLMTMMIMTMMMVMTMIMMMMFNI